MGINGAVNLSNDRQNGGRGFRRGSVKTHLQFIYNVALDTIEPDRGEKVLFLAEDVVVAASVLKVGHGG